MKYIAVTTLFLLLGCSKPQLQPIIEETLPIEPKIEEVETKVNQCPNEMVLVSGNYCPETNHKCLDWLDDPALPYARCKTYEKPSTCLKPKIPLSFCIDQYEQHDNYKRPLGNKSYTECSAICESQHGRLCNDYEWEFACSGEQMLPYPYGYERNNKTCYTEVKAVEGIDPVCGKEMCDLRKPVGSYLNCKSPFDVYDMVGSQDEWVKTTPYYSRYTKELLTTGLKGGHYSHGRNRCQATTTEHSFHYSQILHGCRCCSDIK